jgi:putative inorganic carbon (hco3(-)) transporter
MEGHFMSIGSGIAIVVAAVGGVSVLIAVYRRPQRGLLFLAALTPLHGLLAIVPIGGLAGWKEALVALTAASAWLNRFRQPAPPPLAVFAPWWPVMAIYIPVGTVSALTVFGIFGVVALKVAFFYVAIVAILWLAPFDATDRDQLVGIIMAMGVLTSLVGIAQQLVGPQALVELGYTYGEQVRSTGRLFRTFSTFNQPFPFALYVTLSLLVGGSVALAAPRRPRNLAFLCMTPIMVLSMSTAVVRAAILGLLIGVVWLTIIRYRWGLIPMVFGAFAVGVGWPFLPAGVRGAILATSSIAERSTGWREAVSTILTDPFGEGLGATGAAAQRMAAASGATITEIRMEAAYQPDNYYMKVLIELGPIGVWVIVVLFVITLIWTVKLSRSLPDPDGALALGVSSSILAAMAASTVATYFEIFPLDVHFWLLLGVVGCATAQHQSGSGLWPSARTAAEFRLT